MKPSDAAELCVSPDFSDVALEEAMIALNDPYRIKDAYELRFGSKEDLYRFFNRLNEGFLSWLPVGVKFNCILDADYSEYEWSLRYGNRVVWSPGA